jgi:hypothetical protein
MTNNGENSDSSSTNQKTSWYNYFVNKFHSIVSYFKSSNPIGNILLQADDFSFEYLPFDDYSNFEEKTG